MCVVKFRLFFGCCIRLFFSGLLLQSFDYSSLDYSAVSLDIGYRSVCSVVSTCLDNAMKKYTADAVMHAIVAELKELHDVGFYAEINCKTGVVS